MSDLTRRKKELLNSYNNLCSCYGDIISEQTKTINQLKELLRECHSGFRKLPIYNLVDEDEARKVNKLLNKIDNAIGENKWHI